MPDDEGTGQAPALDETSQNAAEGEAPEEGFDLDRAMRTIRALRNEAKAAKAQLKELETLRAERSAAEEAKLSEQERLQQQLSQTRAELEFERTLAQDRALERAIERSAAKLGVIDPDAAVRLLPREGLEFDAEGNPTNAEAALKQLLEDRPYLAAPSAPQRAPMAATNPGTRHPGAQQRIYTRAEIADRQTWLAHRDDIMLAMREGRIRES